VSSLPPKLTSPGLHGSKKNGGRFVQRWMMLPKPRLLPPMFITSASIRRFTLSPLRYSFAWLICVGTRLVWSAGSAPSNVPRIPSFTRAPLHAKERNVNVISGNASRSFSTACGDVAFGER
jgi:hypothetical protein